MKQSITIQVLDLPKSPNQTKGRHWAVIQKERNEWRDKIGWLAKSKFRGEPFKRSQIHFNVSVGDNRRHDSDNIIASLKPVLDGLTGIVIEDDSIDHVILSYEFNREKPRGLTMTITKIE